ncbi:MAG: hypothetical protein JKY65_16590 [Planctomycetes bacterium]|nr:hypothetical protein [Planctomycetota bacterium]
MSLAREQKINYTVTQGGNIPGDTSRGIPHAYLFDWTGKCVGEGHPSELKVKLTELMSKAPPWIAGGKEFKSAAVNKIAAGLKNPAGFGKALVKLEKLKGESGDTGGEATYLAERIANYGQGILSDAEANESEDAFAAMMGYVEAARNFKGHQIAKKAKARMKALKKDKAFQKELKAGKLLKRMEAVAGTLKSVNGGINPMHPANRKPVAQLMGLRKKLKKKYGDTKAAAKAEALFASFGF